jgi:hypothetical protein
MESNAVAAIVGLAMENAIAPLVAEIADLRSRLAVYEARDPLPGPPGRDGRDGVDGQPGAPGEKGADGLGFDDMAVDFDGVRTLTVKFQRGEQTKSFPVVLPFLHYVGVFAHGAAYHVGDVVTYAGSAWHCQADTSGAPTDGGDGGGAWKLMVKRGRDARDRKP